MLEVLEPGESAPIATDTRPGTRKDIRARHQRAQIVERGHVASPQDRVKRSVAVETAACRTP